eukprot:s4293_g2.t1
MVAAAMPNKSLHGRQSQGSGTNLLALMGATVPAQPRSTQGGGEPQEPKQIHGTKQWNVRAWDTYEYRKNTPTLAQFDRNQSTRRSRTFDKERDTDLISVGPKRQAKKPNMERSNDTRDSQTKKRRPSSRNGGNDGSGKPEEIKLTEIKTPAKDLMKQVKDRAWVAKVRKSFARKFYAPSTLATKNTKRKKVMEILNELEVEAFPLSVEGLTSLAAVLDSTGMKAGDQYLAEAKLLHVEAGYDWPLQLEKQLSMCKRAMQRDKGPEVRAKEVKLEDIGGDKWIEVNSNPKEPRRVAWSYAWALLWMLRAVEAAQLQASDVVVKVEERIVRLHVRRSKTDQKGLGTWRTLKCCGKPACTRDCPFSIAIESLKDLKRPEGNSPLFPDNEGNRVSKVHMVTSWARHLDQSMSGHSARRSGAMHYARRSVPLQTIQFLGRWRSSAVFRYVEEALTELPMNMVAWNETPLTAQECNNSQDLAERKALKPKAKSTRRDVAKQEKSSEEAPNPITNDETKEPVYAISRSRGKVIKHVVGQAAWGIPLDNWATLCGWSFARRNVKVELTRKPTKTAVLCLKCRKIRDERDGVSGAREWAHNINLKVSGEKVVH